MSPACIATWHFGAIGVRVAGPLLEASRPALDAVEAGVCAVELDPEVASVGLGGLPNAEGVVELDALIAPGEAKRFGAVAALRGIATPISVARRVLERSRHPFLVGEGALAFARAQGFAERELLTAASRARWQAWRAGSRRDAGLQHDTVGLVALDAAGRMAAGCSTSGLPFKAPGRVGDSPVIGAGAFCDDAVGGAAATGDGDAMLHFALSRACVEALRAGLAPEAACRAALAPMRAAGLGAEASLVALRADGALGAACIGRADFPYAVWTRAGAEMRAARPEDPDAPR